MKTTIRNEGDWIIVAIDGYLDVEDQVPFQDRLEGILEGSKLNRTPKKVIFDLANLEFVGSTGISAFVNTLKSFNNRFNSRPRYCNVKTEFQRIIQAFDQDQLFEFYETREHAERSFDN